jgi:hypothetical protein
MHLRPMAGLRCGAEAQERLMEMRTGRRTSQS